MDLDEQPGIDVPNALTVGAHPLSIGLIRAMWGLGAARLGIRAPQTRYASCTAHSPFSRGRAVPHGRSWIALHWIQTHQGNAESPRVLTELRGRPSFRNHVTSLRPARQPASPNRRRRPTSSGRPSGGSSSGGGRAPQRPTGNDNSATRHLDEALAAAQQRPEPPATSFAEFGLPQSVVDVLSRAGITKPTAIQARTLPDALAGRDVLGRAQTGSGKTLGFGLPMITRLHAERGNRVPQSPRGLVLVPTRELAQQVADAITPPAGALNLHVATVVGGTSIGRQVDELRRGVDVLVATPGRLMDLMERRAVKLDAVEVAVLDEADHMADLGFLPAVTKILDATPPNRQCMLFSATLDRGVGRLVTRYLSDPAIHAAGGTGTPVGAMDHKVFLLDHEEKVNVAAEIGARPGRTLFFVRTKHGADRLAKQMSRLGVDSAAIHGNLNQNQRTRALDAFSSGRSRVLVATDVAARGLHVDDLDLVVHYDPPADHKDYLHRSGRTARAGNTGTVVSFVEPGQSRDVARMHGAASVSPTTTKVRPGHPAVREVAESGDPITVTAAAPRPAGSSNSSGQGRPRNQGGQGGQRRQSSGGSGSPRGRRGSGQRRYTSG
jgi:superfamily II DNA/RNA helicase